MGMDEEYRELIRRHEEKVSEKKENSEVVKYDPWAFLKDSFFLYKWCSEKFERPKDVVKALRTGNHLAEAAATLFGYCYADLRCTSPEKQIDSERENIEDYYPKDLYEGALSEESWKLQQRWHNSNIDMYSELIAIRKEFSMDDIKYPHGPKEKALKSYVKVMLCATLTILRGNDSKEYDLDLYESLSNAYKIIRSGAVREAENFTVEKFKRGGKHVFDGVLDLLACMACAVVCYSYAHMESQLKKPENDPDYESAFYAYAKAMTFVVRMGLSPEYVEFPPFLYKGIDDEQLTKIVDTWEQMKKNPGMVKHWREMYDSFKKLLEIAQAKGENWWHYDDDMTTNMPFLEYLPRQLEFCKAYMDSPDFMKVIKQEMNDWHKKRMEIDFFEGLWKCLEEETRQLILSAESEWHDGFDRGTFVKSAIEHYSSAIERELHSIIFENENVRRCVESREDRETKTSSDTLPLSYMAKLLRYVRDDRDDVKPIKEVIKALKQEGSLTAKDFTEFLNNVYDTRNYPVHRIKGDVLDCIHSLRKEILGIGRLGYLVKLAEIKKQIQTTSRNG